MTRALALLVGLALAGVAPAIADPDTTVPDPSHNFTIGPLPSGCRAAGTSASCENAAIASLDAARAALGLGAYRLPKDFLALAPDRQLFVLSSLDRVAYGLAPIAGLSAALDADALAGVSADEDPHPSSGSYALVASNWDGGAPNAIVAYGDWMYDDGPGSNNLDCRSPTDVGCWGHRHDILVTAGGDDVLSMGAAAGRDAHGSAGYAMLLVGTEPKAPAPPYDYTWGQAQADGAGTFQYDPMIAPPNTTLVRGTTSSTGRSATFAFSATPSADASFECALVRPHRSASPRYASCRSAKTYRALAPGTFRFYVRAVDPAGTDPTPATRAFTIRRPRPVRQRHASRAPRTTRAPSG
jgi:hypothetical protein